MKTLDMTTTLVIVVPTAVVTSLMMNALDDQYSWLVSLAIAAVVGSVSGLAALGLYRLLRKRSG